MNWKLIDAWAERKGIGYKTRHSWRARGVPHKHRPAIVAATSGAVTLRMMERHANTSAKISRTWSERDFSAEWLKLQVGKIVAGG